MTPQSAIDAASTYMGTVLVNGILCHQWLDGTLLPLLAGGAGDDDGGDDDDGDGDGDADSDDGDDDGDEDDDDAKAKKKKVKDDEDDDDDDDLSKHKSASVRRAFRQATERRITIKARDKTIADLTAAAVEKDAKLAKYEKDGAGDPELKAAKEKAEKERDEARAEVVTLKADNADKALNSEIEDIVTEMKIVQSVKMVKGLLREEGKLKFDSNGELEEDLTRSIKRFVKSGELTVKKKNVSDDEDEGDESGAPARSSGSPMRRAGSVRTPGTESQLKKKYPALNR